ncbi:MAG: lysophospholipid acyltransferase family protein [bacterium]|nr:lysophospholipid acyltransferase family protein [bacterium]
MRKLLGSFHVTGIFWYRFHRWGVCLLPQWGVGIFVFLFTAFFFLVLRRIRKAIASNLAVALGPCSWWQTQVRIYRTMWNFAWCLSEWYEQLSAGRRVSVTVEGEELLREMRQGVDGFIIVTAHIGHWEVWSIGLSSARRRHVHVVREQEMDPQAQAFIEDLIGESGRPAQQPGTDSFEVHFAEQEPNLAVTLLQALRRGELVALQGDRPGARGRTVTVRLFGKPFELPCGSAALARSADVDLLPVFLFRDGRLRSRPVVRPPIRVATTGDRDRAVTEVMERIAGDIEWAIRHRPHQWFCFRELWPED